MRDEDSFQAARQFRRMRWYEWALFLFSFAVYLFTIGAWIDHPEDLLHLGLMIVALFASIGVRMVIIHDIYERMKEADK